MSSFELLELLGAAVDDDPDKKVRTIRIDFAPEDGALADAMRGGDRPEWKRMLAQVANETAISRASQVQGTDSGDYEPEIFPPVSRLREMADEAEELRREELRIEEGYGPSEGLDSLWRLPEEVT